MRLPNVSGYTLPEASEASEFKNGCIPPTSSYYDGPNSKETQCCHTASALRLIGRYGYAAEALDGPCWCAYLAPVPAAIMLDRNPGVIISIVIGNFPPKIFLSKVPFSHQASCSQSAASGASCLTP